MSDRPSTLGELRASGWVSRSVKDEVRENAIVRIRAGEALFPGVLGYEQTVLPQLENALLAGHDVIFLGERGQAKSRMIRSITGLLDEWMPVVAGSEINDDPYQPVSKHARELVSEQGEDTPITWVHRDERFGEKLATPDTSIADLIGEVDPIKVAEGRYLSDDARCTTAWCPAPTVASSPSTSCPIWPSASRSACSTCSKGRDVQIRGYKIRLPLDVLLFASANPEDYTNRGRIITPLKDRFGAQIRTHYPLDVETEVAIALQETRPLEAAGVRVHVPGYMAEIVAQLSQLARQSPHINQRSGVSVRLTVSNLETLVANAARRALILGETDIVPRVTDLEALASSTAGKVEIESIEEGREEQIVDHLLRAATLHVFRDRLPIEELRPVIDAFDGNVIVSAGEDISFG